MLESFTYWLFNSLLWMLIEPEGRMFFWIFWTFSMVIGLYLATWTLSWRRGDDVTRAE